MPILYPNQPLSNDCLDGTNMTLTKPFVVVLRNGRWLRVKIGGTTDGLSAPKLAKLDIQDTNTFLPSVFHDGGYRDQLEDSLDKGQTWQPVTLTKQQIDDAFFELMLDNDVEVNEARIIYEAVKEFGETSFDEDRK